MYTDKLTQAIAEAALKVMEEGLKGNQHKLDKNKNNKIDAEDLKILRKEESETVEEGWDEMMKAAKERAKPQPNGGSGKKQGTAYGGSKQKDVKEEAEQIDELNKSTLASYVKKASHDVAAKGAATRQFANDSEAARKDQNYSDAKKSMDRADKTFAKSWKRREGMAKAVDRLAKEEVEVNERSLSDAEMKKREDVVTGMKKGLQSFKDRYGDRAKEVMYATATKIAKKD